jgi:hypothetical protein
MRGRGAPCSAAGPCRAPAPAPAPPGSGVRTGGGCAPWPPSADGTVVTNDVKLFRSNRRGSRKAAPPDDTTTPPRTVSQPPRRRPRLCPVYPARRMLAAVAEDICHAGLRIVKHSPHHSHTMPRESVTPRHRLAAAASQQTPRRRRLAGDASSRELPLTSTLTQVTTPLSTNWSLPAPHCGHVKESPKNLCSRPAAGKST